jgi:hypothetical protein
VWLVVAPQGYRTHQEDCPLLRDGLGTRLGTPETVLDYADKTFERADVLRYRPRG